MVWNVSNTEEKARISGNDVSIVNTPAEILPSAFGDTLYLTTANTTLSVDIEAKEKSNHTLIIEYYSLPKPDVSEFVVTANGKSGRSEIRDCPYSSMCRELVTSERRPILVVPNEDNTIKVTLTTTDLVDVSLVRIAAVPIAKFDTSALTTTAKCVRKNGA